MASGEIEPPASQLKRLLESNKTELSAVPGGGWRMISMDTSRPPFDDIDVRKAVIAGFDRTAARQQRGGEALGPIAQHLHPAGHGRASRSPAALEGWVDEMDWLANPEGDRAKSAEYFKKAGFASGKYEGDEELLIVGRQRRAGQVDRADHRAAAQRDGLQDEAAPGRRATRCSRSSATCRTPRSTSARRVGWAQDFADPQTMLDPTFNGDNILPTGNSNWPELDVPEVNEAIDEAKLVTDPGRARAGVGRRQQGDHRAGAGDPVHVGLPGRRRLAERARRAERLLARPGTWNFTSLR